MTTEKICPVCFKHFRTNYSFKKYCSGHCRIIDHNRKLVEMAKILEKECPHCHKRFKTASTKRLYCSAKCRLEAQNKRKRDGRQPGQLYTKECPYCHKTFQTVSVHQIYCCTEHCKKAYAIDRQAKMKMLQEPVRCANKLCGRLFKPTHISQRYCCIECAEVDGEGKDKSLYPYAGTKKAVDAIKKEKARRDKARARAKEEMGKWADRLHISLGRYYGIIRNYYDKKDYPGLKRYAEYHRLNASAQ